MTQRISRFEEDRYAELQCLALEYAREGECDNLELMLKHGMSVNLNTHKDDTLLMLASYNGNIETVEMLLHYGAEIDRVNQRGQTPLEGVCFKGSLEIVKLLIKHGAKTDGNAIMYATLFGNKEVVDLLKKQDIKNLKYKLWGIKTEWIVFMTSRIRKLLHREL
jgi:ankyrin repeat protein